MQAEDPLYCRLPASAKLIVASGNTHFIRYLTKARNSMFGHHRYHISKPLSGTNPRWPQFPQYDLAAVSMLPADLPGLSTCSPAIVFRG